MQSLIFATWVYHWCKAGGNTASDLTIQSLTSYVLNICALTYDYSGGSFFAYIANYLGSLSLLLSGKAVVLPIRITFKCIYSAVQKLTHDTFLP